MSGSPFYMAPEIYHGEASSAQSDVYSLGVLAYELLSGLRPHLGNSYEELMISHLTRFPSPVTASNRQVTRPLSRLIELAMAKKPQDRPTSSSLRRALLGALGEDDEQYEPEDQNLPESAPAPAARATVGRHQHLPTVLTPRDLIRPAEPEVKPGQAEAKSWNPFKRKK